MIKLSSFPVLKRFLGTDEGLELKVHWEKEIYTVRNFKSINIREVIKINDEFLVHLSQRLNEPEAQVSFSDHNLSVGRHRCCCKLFTFSFSPEPLGQFNQTWQKASQVKEIQEKNLLLQNHGENFNQTWHKAFMGEGDSSLLKSKATLFSKGRL